MTDKINVLDHGFIRLVDHMGSDLSVIRAARNSYDAAWRAGEDTGSDTKLMQYLWKNHHTTPFEAATFTFEVKAPIFVFRQWHRHRTWSYNEVSARYTELPSDYYIPRPELIGAQSKSSKQARDVGGVFDEERTGSVVWAMEEHCKLAFRTYHQFLDMGVPRELARMVLPLNTYSKMFATVNLMNLFKFLTLRTHQHAQYEIRVYADAVIPLIKPSFPVAVKAWEDSTDWWQAEAKLDA